MGGGTRAGSLWVVRREHAIDAMAAGAPVVESERERTAAPSRAAPVAGERRADACRWRPGASLLVAATPQVCPSCAEHANESAGEPLHQRHQPDATVWDRIGRDRPARQSGGIEFLYLTGRRERPAGADHARAIPAAFARSPIGSCRSALVSSPQIIEPNLAGATAIAEHWHEGLASSS